MYLEFKSSERSSTPYGANVRKISETLCFVNILDKDETMDNVQEHNMCTNLPSSQTLRLYLISVNTLSLSLSLSLSMAVQLFGPSPFFKFRNPIQSQ
jgi:hypothetical protein